MRSATVWRSALRRANASARGDTSVAMMSVSDRFTARATAMAPQPTPTSAMRIPTADADRAQSSTSSTSVSVSGRGMIASGVTWNSSP